MRQFLIITVSIILAILATTMGRGDAAIAWACLTLAEIEIHNLKTKANAKAASDSKV